MSYLRVYLFVLKSYKWNVKFENQKFPCARLSTNLSKENFISDQSKYMWKFHKVIFSCNKKIGRKFGTQHGKGILYFNFIFLLTKYVRKIVKLFISFHFQWSLFFRFTLFIIPTKWTPHHFSPNFNLEKQSKFSCIRRVKHIFNVLTLITCVGVM